MKHTQLDLIMPSNRTSPRSKSKRLSRFLQALWVFFLVLNGLAYIGAYSLTHFTTVGHLGLGMPRPTSSKLPTDIGLDYATQKISINQTEWLETWFIPVQPAIQGTAKGTVLLFPGNAGSKAKQLLAPAQAFHELGYDTVLVDFRGVGGSSGSTTTLGARESQDVALAFDNAVQINLNQPLILYGVSMGSAAVLKAVAHKQVAPAALIIELPFARTLDAVRSRLRGKVPIFPLAELLVFWGSVQHRFNAFTHNPVTYAQAVDCPTLILQGDRDPWTTEAEIRQILHNLGGPKQLILFPTGHSLLVTVDKPRWQQEVGQFLKDI
jgi:uncharacterized protein